LPLKFQARSASHFELQTYFAFNYACCHLTEASNASTAKDFEMMDRVDARQNPRRRPALSLLLFAVALILVVVVILVFDRRSDFSKMRPPNSHETFYQYVAFELDAPALCRKLSPSAVIPAGIFIAQSYARSDCYAKIALRYDRPSLCWNAKRLGLPAILSEQISPLRCFLNVTRRAPDVGISTYMPAREDLVSIFAEMGYRPEELYREGITPPLLNIPDAYRRLARHPDLLNRIAALTSAPGSSLTPAERMHLFELAAHVSNDVSWCVRIPADQLDPATERRSKVPGLFQRDRCILEVASDTRKPDSCKLIPVRADDWPGMMSRRSICEHQASLPPNKYHYGAPTPPTDDETRQIITALGYPLPDVRDVSANEIETACFYFIWQMAATDRNANNNPATGAARVKFLSRVAALPSY
jgi:hypothetical protein